MVVSKEKYPILAISVPIYDMLMDQLEEFQNSIKISQEMKTALENGMEKIKAYYAKTDDSSMYAIATSKFIFLIFANNYCQQPLIYIKVLDPRLKLEYYEAHDWDKAWIKVAKDIALEAYKSYAPLPEEMSEPTAMPEDRLMAHMFKKCRVIRKNEMDTYISAISAHHLADVLEWWKVSVYFLFLMFTLKYFHYAYYLIISSQLHVKEFPHLSKMARDYMAIPGI